MPQYQVAVWKARASELLINVKAAREASDVYYMANGVRPTSRLELDVQIPYVCLSGYGGVNTLENGSLLTANGNQYVLDVDGYVGARAGTDAMYINIALFYPEKKAWKDCVFLCRCTPGVKVVQQACLSLGGAYHSTLPYGMNAY